MKKLLLSVAALGCFVSSHAQWSTNAAGPFPAGPLHYNGGTVVIGSGSTANASLNVIHNAYGNSHIPYTDGTIYLTGGTGSGGSGNFIFRSYTGTYYANRFFINGVNGNVGIGTTDPGLFKLAVEGKVGANEVQVKVSGSGWYDHVFYNTYKLRPLADVEKYVKENHHLPEIPSAAEVEKNGINLGEMDALLLKKIEELTLYVIEQNKKIEALEQQAAGKR